MHLGHLLFGTHGRISRRLWWLSQVIVWVLFSGTLFIYHKFGFHDAIFGGIINLLAFVAHSTINVKRLHDRGMSGWWIFFFVIPVIGWIPGFFVLGLGDSKDIGNKHGATIDKLDWRGSVETVIPLFLLFIFIAGCAGAIGIGELALSDGGLTAIELGTLTAKKIFELHEAGVDEKILDEVHDAIRKAHEIIDKHHRGIDVNKN